MYQKYFKRPLDFIMALVGLIILSPLLLVIAILVRIKLGSPVIFKQPRPGLNGEIFTMYKFRTMTDEKDEDGKLLPDTVRLTKFGRFLRNSSLDELPELFNILRGDMSLVGPRPLLVKYLPLYDKEQMRRHDVRPGLTGYSQVYGRNALAWEERFRLDVYYTKNITFRGDLEIILKTIGTVMKRDGIDTQETRKYTMMEFTGTKKAKIRDL
jgi:undecaprenyl phosphate N,N'-diacetylbacillosamine 1-phosphate transferase